MEPTWILGKDIDNNIAVYQDFHHSPRVRAMISSVLMPVVAFPRMWEISVLPRLFPSSTFRTRNVSPSISNATSVFGKKPNYSLIVTGIVTCPFEVMRMNPISSPILTFHILTIF